MRKVDIAIGAFFFVAGASVLPLALALDLYQRSGIPGAGFFPLVLSVTILSLGAALVISRLIGPAERFGKWSPPSLPSARRALGVWITIAVGVVLMPLAGFVWAMLALTAILLLGIEGLRSWRALATVVMVPLSFYLLFGVLLDVRLPAGVFGT